MTQFKWHEADSLNVHGIDDTADLVTTANLVSAWPIGSVFISVVSTNPNTLLGGGTWTAFGAGRVLVSLDAAQTEFDTVQETGGSKTVALSSAELAAHTHTGPDHFHSGPTHSHTIAHTHQADLLAGSVSVTGGNQAAQGVNVAPDAAMTTGGSNTADSGAAGSGSTGNAGTGASGSTGSGTAHNNLQPYIVVYMWLRTA